MPAPVISTVRNTPADGLHLAVTLAGAPASTPQFYVSRLPGIAFEVTVMPFTAQPVAGTTVVTTGFTQPPAARRMVVVGNQASCTGTVIVAGTDAGGNAYSENFVLSGVTEIESAEEFLTVTSVTIPTRGAAGDQVRVRSTGTEVEATGSGTAWEIEIPLAEGTELRLIYYVAIEDDDGISEEECEWLCLGSNLDVKNQVEKALHEILVDNRKAIDRSLQIWVGDTFPNTQDAKVAKVLRGYPSMSDANNKFPLISVRIHDLAEDLYFGNPYTDVVPVTGTIYCYAFHQAVNGQSLEAMITAVGMGVFNLVNQAHNLNVRLDCGLTLKAAHCENLHTDEQPLGEAAGYMAVAEMSYKGELFMGKLLR